MGASFTLPFFSADVDAAFDRLPDELKQRIVRILLRDEPLAAARLGCCCKAMRRLTTMNPAGDVGPEMDEEMLAASELRAARALLTQAALNELRVLTGEMSAMPSLVRQISRQLTFVKGPPAPTHHLMLNLSRVPYCGGCNQSVEAREQAQLVGQRVAAVVRLSGTLTTLHLIGSHRLGSDYRFGSEGAEPLAAALSRNDVLTSLSLRGMQIRAPGAAALGAALRTNRVLSFLDLGQNPLGCAGVAALAAPLAHDNRSLEELSLPGVNLGIDGVVALASALRSSLALKRLDLSSNRLAALHAAKLAEALERGAAALTYLNIADNPLDAGGAAAILEAQKLNTRCVVHMDARLRSQARALQEERERAAAPPRPGSAGGRKPGPGAEPQGAPVLLWGGSVRLRAQSQAPGDAQERPASSAAQAAEEEGAPKPGFYQELRKAKQKHESARRGQRKGRG